MARGQNFTRHQQGIVKRYYEHKDSQTALQLQELVSELYLCEDARKRERLWERAATMLTKAGANKARMETVLASRDIEALGKLVGEVVR